MDDRTTEDLFPEDTKKIEDGTDTNVGSESDELVSRRAVIKSVTREYNRRRTGDGLKLAWIEKAINGTPSAQPKYEPVKAEDFAKTMSENTLYGFMAWHGEALALMERHGFVICKKTM